MTVGYRFWVVRPGDDVLLSPYVAPPAHVNVLQASEISLGIVVRGEYGPAWDSARMTATCSTDLDHRPPAPGCICGIYAERTAELARRRAQRHRLSLDANRARARRRGYPVPPWPSYVVGRVELAVAVPFVPPPPMLRVADDELRAASAEILALCVMAGAGDPHVGGRLAARYGIPISDDEAAIAPPVMSGE